MTTTSPPTQGKPTTATQIIKERVQERMDRKRRRQIAGYLRTASRRLADIDRRRGVQQGVCEMTCAYAADPTLQQCIDLACEQVAAINVPQRAVKLYCDWDT